MNDFLTDLALAVQKHEGWHPGSMSFRRNNPGNLRSAKTGKFLVFENYFKGFSELKYDLHMKIIGVAKSVLNYISRSGQHYERLTFQTIISIYAPSEDFNNPVSYCNALCIDPNLTKYKLTPSTPLSVLAMLIRGEISEVPHPPVYPTMTDEQRLKSAENALKWASPIRASMLRRLIDRLRKRLL